MKNAFLILAQNKQFLIGGGTVKRLKISISHLIHIDIIRIHHECEDGMEIIRPEDHRLASPQNALSRAVTQVLCKSLDQLS